MAYATFQKTYKTFGYMNSIVCKITYWRDKVIRLQRSGIDTIKYHMYPICIPWPTLLCGLYNEFVVNHNEQCFGGLLAANGQVKALF